MQRGLKLLKVTIKLDTYCADVINFTSGQGPFTVRSSIIQKPYFLFIDRTENFYYLNDIDRSTINITDCLTFHLCK